MIVYSNHTISERFYYTNAYIAYACILILITQNTNINFLYIFKHIMNVRDHGILVRSQAIGMLEGGLPHKAKVAGPILRSFNLFNEKMVES